MSFAVVIVPGRAPLSSFMQHNPSIPEWSITLTQPSEISEICVALTQPLVSPDLGGKTGTG